MSQNLRKLLTNFKYMHLLNFTENYITKLAEQFDDETKNYYFNDCLINYNNKSATTAFEFYGLVDDYGEVLTVFIISTSCLFDINMRSIDRVAYIERCFTPLKHRCKGYFTLSLSMLHNLYFNRGYNYIKMYMDKNVKVYNKLNFARLFDTKDGKYTFCLQPLIHRDFYKNNTLTAKEGVYNFYTDQALQYITNMQSKN